MLRRLLVGALVALALVATALSAQASAPPVGPLPKGVVTSIQVQHGLLFALVLPRPATGLTWRGPAPPTRRLRARSTRVS